MPYPIADMTNGATQFIPTPIYSSRSSKRSIASPGLTLDNLRGSDRSLEKADRKFQNLQKEYHKWSEKFKQVGSLFNSFLAVCEYLSNNKESISFLMSQCSLKKEGVIENLDGHYKWINCIAPLSLYLIRYFLALNVEEKFGNLSKTSESSDCTATGEYSSEYSGSVNDTLETVKDRFQIKLDRDKREILNKATLGLASLATKTLSSTLTFIQLLPKKGAEKVSKYAHSVFTNLWALSKFNTLSNLQHEWDFLLHPRTFLIAPKNREPIDEQENLAKEFYDFLETLKSCGKISKVHALFRKHNFGFPPPKTQEDLSSKLGNEYYTFDLAQSFFCHAGKRIATDSDEINKLLKKNKETFEIKAKSHSTFSIIKDQVDRKQKARDVDLSQEEAENFFSKLHITSPYTFLARKSDRSSFSDPAIPAENKFNSLETNDEDLWGLRKLFSKGPEGELDMSSGGIAVSHPTSPPSSSIWEEAVQDEDYRNLISREWVAHQENTAQLIVQGLRQALLSKNKVENKFLLFEAVKNSFKILCSALQFYLFFPVFSTSTFNSILEVFFKDFSKVGSFKLFNIGSHLYPKLKLKIDSIFLLIAKHFFAVNYKPHEYSLDGYRLEGQRRMIRFVLLIYSLLFLSQEGLLWVNFKVFDLFSQRLERRSLSEDSRYIELNQEREKVNKYWHDYKKKTDEQIKSLKFQDLNLIFQTPPPPATSNKKTTDQIVEGGTTGDTIVEGNTTIDTIVDALRDADVRFFPKATIVFFETHLGFHLTEESKGSLKKYLENFFTKEEGDFIGSFSSSRFNYLNK